MSEPPSFLRLNYSNAVDGPHCVYPSSVCQWTRGILLPSDCHESCLWEHWCAGTSSRRLSILLGVKRSGTAGSHRDATVNHLRNHQTVSTAATLFLCSHQPFTRFPLLHMVLQFYLLTHQRNGNTLKTCVCGVLSWMLRIQGGEQYLSPRFNL